MYITHDQLHPSMIRETVIAVVSIIRVPETPIYGHTSRSVFSTDERRHQTLHQLRLLRKLVPSATIIVLECSPFLENFERDEFVALSDLFLHYNRPEDKQYCIEHPNKGLGELHVVTDFLNRIQGFSYKWFCKFGGRYCTRPDFNIQHLLQNVPVTACVNAYERQYAQTVFYVIPKTHVRLFLDFMRPYLDARTSISIETLFSDFFDSLPEYCVTPYIGIEGYGAIDNKLHVF